MVMQWADQNSYIVSHALDKRLAQWQSNSLIGKILGLTMALETGDVQRFASAGKPRAGNDRRNALQLCVSVANTAHATLLKLSPNRENA